MICRPRKNPFRRLLGGVSAFFLFLLFPQQQVLAGEAAKEPSLETLLEMSLEELIKVEITSATGTPKTIRSAPAVASVITAADIEHMGATTLDEVLETIPGLHVYPSQGGLVPGYTIRGIQTLLNPQTLVLVNGLPITTVYNGRRIAGLRIPVANISRIEVIRGPGSAVHGADAYSGTVNVITKEGREIDGVTAGLRAGSFDTYSGWTQYGGIHKGWDVALSLEYQESDGDDDRIVPRDLQTALDAVLNAPFGQPNASLAPGKLPTHYRNVDTFLNLQKENWTFRVWGSLGDDMVMGGGATLVLDNEGEIDYRLLLCDMMYKNDDLSDDWDLRVRFSYMYQHSDTLYYLFPPGALLPLDKDGNLNPAAPVYWGLFTEGYIGEPIQTDTIPAIDFETLYDGLPDHWLRFGAGFKIQDEETENYVNFGSEALVLSSLSMDPFNPTPIRGNLTYIDDGPSVYLPDLQRRIWHALLQDEWAFAEKWELTAGVRYDHYSDFGGTTNPRVALVWETRQDLTSKILYGRAFRAPSFAEGHNLNNPSVVGNANLEPETIDTYELAFDYQPAATFRSLVNFFYYEIDDLIDYVPDLNGITKTAQNAKDQKGRGLELEAVWKIIDTLELRGNFAFQRSEDRDTGETVPDAPGKQFYANVHWEFLPLWSIDAQYFWIGDRRRAKADPRPEIKDNDIVNLTLRRKDIAEHWDFALAVRNVFDENVLEPCPYNPDVPEGASMPEDFLMEGRSLWAEVRYKF